MSLEFTHKPNYFMFAQLLMRYVQQQTSSAASTLEVSMHDLSELFHHDTASITTNLDSILNIADEYKVETVQGDQKIIESYSKDSTQQVLILKLNAEAMKSLSDGKRLIEPNATDYN
ncbi:hypothetical protein [Acinetobacter sp. MD2(2019)]|uniref:hypothetical protein n=1 Tax=Acinetobacter sp. MD2(2019) TaxID=2605273 RepID=UPI002D1F3F98|nr:hypothetical protein [Acinetobacter sp. MD2(2019)]MEB3754632.1 hypothetical protein [Acinetobacter sp. MD2(2019)]